MVDLLNDPRTIRRALAERLGRSVSVSGPADDMQIAVSAAELSPAVEALLLLDARHVMLLGLEVGGSRGTRLRRALGSTTVGSAVEEVMAVPGGPLVRLRAELAADASGVTAYPSLTPLIPAAQWDEREARDMFGVIPIGHPDPRPLVYHAASAPTGSGAGSGAGSAAGSGPAGSASGPRYRPFVAHGEGVYQLPVGPIHAGIIEPGHFRFSAVGESVLHLDARLFYTHRGLERLVEGRTFESVLPVVERACGVCTVTHATAFSRAVERLTETEIPPRARLARVLLAEMERLYNHVGDLGNMCAGVGFNFGVSRLGWHKERLLRLNEGLTGHRYLTGIVAPGGLRVELDAAALAGLGEAVREIDHDVRGVVRVLLRSESFMTRLRGTGIVHTADALRLGALGVAARASGVPIDLRIDRPAEGYEDLDLALIGAATGDVAARFHVRAQEAAVSAGIVRDLAAHLPGGAISVSLRREARAGASAIAGAEGPRGASWIWIMAGPRGTIRRLHLRSASFANWPVVAAAVPGNLVPDFPIINKSFELCYACTDR